MSVDNIPSTPIAARSPAPAVQAGGKQPWMVVATVAAAVGFGLVKLGVFALHAHAWVNVVRLVTGHPTH